MHVCPSTVVGRVLLNLTFIIVALECHGQFAPSIPAFLQTEFLRQVALPKNALDADTKIRQETRTPVIPHWSVTVGDATTTDPEGKPINLKEKDLLVEIDRKGEEFLRKRLNQITGINTHLINGVKAKRNSLTTIKPILTNSEKITKDTVRHCCPVVYIKDAGISMYCSNLMLLSNA